MKRATNHTPPEAGTGQRELAKRKKAAAIRAAQTYQAQRTADAQYGVRVGVGRSQYKGA